MEWPAPPGPVREADDWTDLQNWVEPASLVVQAQLKGRGRW